MPLPETDKAGEGSYRILLNKNKGIGIKANFCEKSQIEIGSQILDYYNMYKNEISTDSIKWDSTIVFHDTEKKLIISEKGKFNKKWINAWDTNTENKYYHYNKNLKLIKFLDVVDDNLRGKK